MRVQAREKECKDVALYVDACYLFHSAGVKWDHVCQTYYTLV